MKQTIRFMIGVLLCLGSHLSMTAQGFNPDNPAEPYQYNKVTVLGSPSEAVSWLSGAGYYKEGQSVQLSSSRRSSVYTFSHWEKDGEWYSNEQSPKYTMDNNAHTFTACYEYTPASPDEPWISDNRLYLVAEPLTACSFNLQSGTSFKYDQTVSLAAYANSTYTFLGWYKDGVLQSKNLSYAFNMPEGDVKLVARFEYNPMNPSEPEGDGSQTNVQTTPTGDSNGDGVVDVADAVRVINICLSTTYDEKSDANNDGVVDVADAVRVINLCLKVTKLITIIYIEMKKTYISPKNYTIEVEIETLISTSGVATIGYDNEQKADENYEVLSNKQRPGTWDNLWGE